MTTLDPTIGEYNTRRRLTVDGVEQDVDVLDTSGYEDYTSLYVQWIKDANVMLVLYSTTSRASFDSARRYFATIARALLGVGASTPVLLVATKCDAEDERVVSAAEGEVGSWW